MIRFIFVFFFGLQAAFSVGQNSFDFLYRTDEDEQLFHAINDAEDNVILCGSIGNRYGTKDGLLMKIYPDGSYVTKRITSPGPSGYFNAVRLTNDSNYVFFGTYTTEGWKDRTHLWIYETDTGFNKVTEESYLSVDDYYHSCYVAYVIRDNDNNWIMAGYKNDSLFYDVWMCKLNSQYDTLLNKTFIVSYEQNIYELTIVPSSNEYMIIGGGFDRRTSSVELFRMDSVFNETGFTNVPKHYPNKYLHGATASSDLWLNDTSLIITTHVLDTSKRKQDDHVGLFKIDTSGRIYNKLIMGKPDTLDYVARYNSMATISTSCIYAGGFVNYLAFWPEKQGYYELYMVDTGLNLLGYTQFGGDAMYWLNGILPTPDSGCLMYGERYDYEEDGHEHDIQIVKFSKDDLDIITTAGADDEPFQTSIPYPNPVKDHINIPLPGNKAYNDLRLQVYMLNGKKVADRPVTGRGNTIRSYLKPLPSGLYVYKILSFGKTITTGKFIKQ